MTKREIRVTAFNLIEDYVLKGNSTSDFNKPLYLNRAYTVVRMLAELNMLTDRQIQDIEDNIYEGIMYD